MLVTGKRPEISLVLGVDMAFERRRSGKVPAAVLAVVHSCISATALCDSWREVSRGDRKRLRVMIVRFKIG